MDNKKEIKKAFDGLTTDVLDNYNSYSIEHKALVKQQLKAFNSLNDILSVYNDKKQKEEIEREFNTLRDQLLEHFDEYSPEHKELVKQELKKYEDLNNLLDCYDKPKQKDTKKTWLESLLQAFGIKK